MSSVKITVVRRFDKHELFSPLPDELELIPSPCRLEEGQVFTCSNEMLPNNFCTWAFNDIFRDVIHLIDEQVLMRNRFIVEPIDNPPQNVVSIDDLTGDE